jgi:hypothetical protein
MNDLLNEILLEYDRIYLLPLLTNGRISDLPDTFSLVKQHIKNNYNMDYIGITIQKHSIPIYNQDFALISARVKDIYNLYRAHIDTRYYTEDSVTTGFDKMTGEVYSIAFTYIGAPMHNVSILTNITSLHVNQPKDQEEFMAMETSFVRSMHELSCGN